MSRREPQQYLKIAQHLSEEIRQGRLAAGDFLPSEAELCQHFQSSRGPVRQAMAMLRSEGKISSGRGRRSVVLGDVYSETFEEIYSFSARLRIAGLQGKQKILWLARRPAPPAAARALQLRGDVPVVYVHRIRDWGQNQYLQQEHYFPLRVGRHILRYGETDGSMHSMLQAAGVRFDSARREFHITPAGPREAKNLQVAEGTPLWVTRLALFDHGGDPVEYRISTQRADQVTILASSVRGNNSPLQVAFLAE